MSYRSIKRVLGETHLERKCRLLFGICLLLLIGGAFFWADRIAEKLVLDAEQLMIDNMQRKGRDFVQISMLADHADLFVTPTSDDPELQSKIRFEQLFKEGLLKKQNLARQVISLNEQRERYEINAQLPSDPEERQLLQQLQSQLAQQAASPEDSDSAAGTEPEVSDDAEDDRLFIDRRVPELGAYHYYEPIKWNASCVQCHEAKDSDVPESTPAAAEIVAASGPPQYYLKVVIPYTETGSAVNRIRAILISAAILTVFLAMVALYIIVRYVIVKPLQHLRDVSEDISQGKTESRADLQTGDEFEDLAHSFNRMVVHLTDTQAKLRQANAELDGKVDQLAQLNLRLYELNQIKSEFLANMSHELRTPLNSIIGFSEVLQGISSLNEKQKRYAENIQKSGHVLLEMINDVLDLAKLEAGKMDVRPTELHIDQLITAHCDMVRSLTEDKNIDLIVDVPPGLPPLFQDQVKVQQILTNLLSNAIKFTPEGGRITVSARRDAQKRLKLTVADTGVGIAEEEQEIIFEKFRQGTSVMGDDGLTREFSGTGLGLSIVKELCKLLGGHISLESSVGIGSTFTVTLPWTCETPSDRQQALTSQLDEMTKTGQLDFVRGYSAGDTPVAAEVRG